MTPDDIPVRSERNREYLFKEIDIIQGIINRMASNSFLIKGWAITIVVATLIFEGKTDGIWIAFIPLFFFWGLDAFFLRQEKLFRKLYDWVVSHRLNSDENLFNMSTFRFEKEVTFSSVLFSKTLIPFYCGIALSLVVAEVILYSQEIMTFIARSH
jgi:hypothetical protein